jgi:hypothetical protein
MCSRASSIIAVSGIVTDVRSRKSVITVRAESCGSAYQGSTPGICKLVFVTTVSETVLIATSVTTIVAFDKSCASLFA